MKIDNHQQRGFAFLAVLLLVLIGGGLVETTKLVIDTKRTEQAAAEREADWIAQEQAYNLAAIDHATALAVEDTTTALALVTVDQQVITPSIVNQPITAGLHDGTGYVLGDTDLLATNIINGVTIFGITGTTAVTTTTVNSGYTYGDSIPTTVLTTATGTGSYNVTNLTNSLIKQGTTWGVSLGNTGTLTPNGGTATVTDLFTGTTAHLTNDWDLDTGTLALACNTTTFNGTANLVADSYDGTGDGTNRWCITNSADVTTSDIMSGKIAWVDGVEVTGTLATQTFSVANDTVSAGYYAATTLSAVDTDLATGNILAGSTIFGIAGNSNVVNTSTGTATAGDLLSGLVAWVDGSEVTGTMNNNGLFALMAGTADQSVTAGYYSGGTLTGDADLTTANILSGVTIFGVAGNSNVVNTATGTATASDLLSGLVAWVDGASIMGTIPTNTLSVLNDTVSAGYYSATTLSAVDTDLTSSNILAGSTIFGVTGNSNVVNTSTGTATAGDLLSGLVAWVDGSEVTGTISTNTLSALNDTVSAGYYAATTLSAVDTDLATGNILAGSTIFGVAGNSNVVNTATGTAAASDMLSGLVAWVDGASITGTIPTNTLSVLNDTVSAGYYAATTLSAVDTDLVAGNILSGATIFGVTGNSNVVNTSTGTATASDLLSGLVAWVDGASVTGTIPTNTLSVLNDTVSAGYYAATTLSAVDTDLATGNILSGATIFGISGNSNVVNTSTGTATASDLLSGLVAWVDGASVTGTIPTNTLSALNDTISAGYYASTTLSAVDTDLIAGNIVSGVTIFGIAGSAVIGYTYGDENQAYVLTTATSAGTYNAANLNAGTVKSGTAFGVGLTGDYPSATYPLTGAGTVAGASGVVTGKVAWSNDGSQITGTGVMGSACSTQQYYDSHVSATEENNCSLTWTANPSGLVTGDDALSGRGGYDPLTGLTWSNYLAISGSTVVFASWAGTYWSWDGYQTFTVTAANATAGATYTNNDQTFTVVTTITGTTTLTTIPTGAPTSSGTLTKTSGTGDDTITFSSKSGNTYNITVGGKSASQLCSERGDGWRLPTQRELVQGWIDGSYWNLTQTASYWSTTEYDSVSAFYVNLSSGYTTSATKSSTARVRCVR